ncbi:MAG: RNA polymerase factor sigma-54 [Gammaproteobacteria bacterium]|jgi:RNA polymerase sigma-54 factor|nr:RNA polymerase factor sigma-54 [Gammaproteobacteria bacterium]MDP6615606.1 RNA polymerase factor sigma-54 [Gammaproteobacteria bacterium]MDP6694720.1 RNA polymerase factor sigma-54 [Gammaproteobacteria bacterium]
MAKLSLQLKLGQQLTMTPQLQQAIRLLQMPVLELNTQLLEALETNVMLEQEEPGEATPGGDEAQVVAGEEVDQGEWADIYGSGRRSENWSGTDYPQVDVPDTSGDSLQDHLLWQLEIDDITPREAVTGQAIVDSINDDGYLAEDLDTILATLPPEASFTLSEVEAVLERIQQLDPAGVGARDLAECIGIQLGQLDPSEPGRELALKIAGSELDMVADHEFAMLRRRLSVSDAELDIAIALIRSCHPKPGSTIQSAAAEYVIPDVYVRKQDGRWVVDVNRSIAPRLRVNQAYADLLRGNGEHSTLRTQLQEARWLVRSLEIRHDTLLRVAISIVERQVNFFEHGEEAMKPMILKDIAETLQMHESTISRVTTNKFMHTPRGVFEFRYFFSSQLGSDDGSEQSSTAIRARIKRLVGKENPAKPLSDSKITKLLEDEGIKVARRTVAKYREAMNIAPSNERRERVARR